jgi:hypothetical protein
MRLGEPERVWQFDEMLHHVFRERRRAVSLAA